MTYAHLETTLHQGVAVIWMNRPQIRNALSAALIAELTDAVSAASEDPRCAPSCWRAEARPFVRVRISTG